MAKNSPEMGAEDFFVTGGTLRHDARSYVERRADSDLHSHIHSGEYCYVLTSRQMGKSSLMIRVASRLRREGFCVLILDLTAIGQNVTPEQWYDGLMVSAGRQLRCEDELEAFWESHSHLGPVQRFFTTVRDAIMPRHGGRLVIFVDEIDVVRSLPFSTDEFFGAIRECCNRRTQESDLVRLNFCLLGVATPSELIRDTRTSPFNVGQRIELNDFTASEAAAYAPMLSRDAAMGQGILERIVYWTHGHPYLTQRLCQAVQHPRGHAGSTAEGAGATSPEMIDSLVERLFFETRARERDENLLFVRERILRSRLDLCPLLDLYERIWNGALVADDETNAAINELRLAGIVRCDQDGLKVRNRIYKRVFDLQWIEAIRPLAELQRPDGTWIRLGGTCTMGRSSKNSVVLTEECISRRHALIHEQQQNEFWIVDLGSSNGTYVNNARLSQPTRLKSGDEIMAGSARFIFQQNPAQAVPGYDSVGQTTEDVQSSQRWMLVVTRIARHHGGTLTDETEAALRGQWFASCKQSVEEGQGVVCRFFEDGFLATWDFKDGHESGLVRAVRSLESARSNTGFAFQCVLHSGAVFAGVTKTGGQERLFGKELEFVLALAKTTRTLQSPFIATEHATQSLSSEMALTEMGEHEVPGFTGVARLFEMQPGQ